jgi:hypothetical protein
MFIFLQHHIPSKMYWIWVILFVALFAYYMYQSQEHFQSNMIPMILPGTEKTVLTGSPSCIYKSPSTFNPRGISSFDMSELDMNIKPEQVVAESFVDAFRPNNKPLNASIQDSIPEPGMDFRSIPSGPYTPSGISYDTNMA